MKKLVFVFGLLLILSSNTFSQQGWFWQNPYPGSCGYRDIEFVSENSIWAVGYNGTIVKSTDGGNTWQNIYLNLSIELTGLSFIDEMHGTIAGENGTIIHTTNGGIDWQWQESGTSSYLTAVSFLNNDIGIAVGGAEVLKTTDGGNTWVNQNILGSDYYMDVIMIDSSNIYLIGTREILKTSDAGVNWSYYSTSHNWHGPLYAADFIDVNNGIVVGDGITLKTSDGGLTWVINPVSNGLYDVEYFSYNIAIAPAASGHIIKTTDGGTTWFPIYDAVDMASISFINENIGFSCSGSINWGGLFKTTDGGLSWFEVSRNGISWVGLNSITFFNEYKGVAVGYDYDGIRDVGCVLNTTDGGVNWVKQNSPTNSSLNSINCISENVYISVGNEGTIIKTTDNGINWSIKQTGFNYKLNNCFFISSEVGWVVGVGGDWPHYESIILKTTNGGENWFNQNSYSESELFSIFFNNENEGIVVGDSGLILKTSDGGNTWSSISSGTYNYLFDVSFANNNYGLVLSVPGLGASQILKTTDGGNVWTFLSEIEDYVTRIMFINEDLVVALGSVPYISTNGGISWQSQVVPSPAAVNDIFYLNSNLGWIVGYDGTILHTTNGGVTFIEDEENNFTQPKEFLLNQNYPNPFNPSTKISWQSPVSGWQTLKVYDVLGNEVATLVDEYRNAGSYEVEFKSAVGSRQLANGVYFYCLKAGDYVETKKMILLK
ncbi:MAG: YCF48-related protein [Ignavibacterium sp.]|jgi:photosystem II stability/assembly factor-like uncharacterized protein|nr:YCF48-related protein [Ignavibacterium sp.]